ncbi:MAG: IS3 family transposase [Thermoplasmatales archaeon]
MSIARICRAMDISRSSIYYRKADHTLNRKPRSSPGIENDILSIAEKRTTYGYMRIWAILRNSGTVTNIKTVRRIMKKHNLAIPYAKHKNRTRKRDLTKSELSIAFWKRVSTIYQP